MQVVKHHVVGHTVEHLTRQGVAMDLTNQFIPPTALLCEGIGYLPGMTRFVFA